jgi:hypothetical protein
MQGKQTRMMILTTRYLGEMDGYQVVAWATGLKKRGLVHVCDLPDYDTAAMAELVAIRHLLFERQVFDRPIVSGTGICLMVSTPVIKKVARGKTSKTHLLHLGRFFNTSLSGVTLQDAKPTDIELPGIEDDVPALVVSAGDNPDYDIIDTPALGKIRITLHVIEQYEKRLASSDLKRPMISLAKRLKHEGLVRQPLPDAVTRHKLRKYGSVDELEIWGHSSSQMHFTVLRDPASGIGTLVTIYRRHSDY